VKSKLWKLLAVMVILTMLVPGLAGCATPTPEVQVVTQVVKETVIIAGTPEVVEKVVTKLVEKEVVVTATPVPKPKTVTLTFFEEPDTLNAMYSGMWFAALAMDFFNPGLWTWDNNLESSLEMAAEFPTKENGLISEDGLTITIPINPDAKWSDGEPVTADDFVFTYEMVLDPANIAVQSTWPYADYLESVTAEDNSLVLKFTESFAPWATTMFSFVLPEHVLRPVYEAEGTLDDAEWNRTASVVNGAFKLKEWEAASHLIFEANDDYWRGRPTLDQVNIIVVPDDEAQMAAIKTGDTDVGIFLSYADIPTINALEDVDVVTVLSGYNESWFFNLNTDETAAKNGHPALQDVGVRQAQTQVVAMQYLEDVGIGIEIANNSYDTMWNSYGQDGPIATGNYDIAQWSASTSFPDPNIADWLCSEIPSDESPDGGNWYGICDEELNALFQAQAVEMDPDTRIEQYHNIGQTMSEKVYWLGVWHDNDVWTINRRTRNLKISGANPFWNCFEWDVSD